MAAESLHWNIDDENFCVWDWNLQSGTVGLSENWRSFLGFGQAGVSNSEWFNSVLHPEDLPRVLSYLEDHITGEAWHGPFYFRLRHKDQNYLYFESKGAVVLKDPAGLPGHVIWACGRMSQGQQA